MPRFCRVARWSRATENLDFSTFGVPTMAHIAKIAAIAVVAVIVAKRLPVVKDYL